MKTFKTIVSFLTLFLILTVSTNTFSQDEAPAEEKEEPTFSFSGSIDTYFHTTFKMQNAFYGDAYASSTSFADGKGFALGMANFIASYSGEKVGFVGDIVLGPRGKAAIFGTGYGDTGQGIVNQLYAYYNFNDKLKFNLGQFNTFLGYEVISPAVNFHYSTSYLFSWGPFNHTGARLDFTGEKFVAKLAVMNPTDILEFNPVNTFTLGAQVGMTGDKGGVYLNFLVGDQDGTLDEDTATPGEESNGTLFQADVTLGYNLSEKFYLGFNASIQQVGDGETFDGSNISDIGGDPSSFLGFAVYPKLSLSENFALGLRAEYFSDKNNHLGIFGLDTNGDGSVIDFTLSGNLKSGRLTFIPEFRIDMTSEDSFYKAGSTSGTNILPSFNFAAVYSF